MNKVICTNFESYLKHLTIEVRKFGLATISPLSLSKEFRLGFKSPDIECLIGIRYLSAAASRGKPWRENKELIDIYKSCGGKTPLVAWTQRPSNAECVEFYKLKVAQAISKGERLRTQDLTSRPQWLH